MRQHNSALGTLHHMIGCFKGHSLHPGRLSTSKRVGALFHNSLAGTDSFLAPSGLSGASAMAVRFGGWTMDILFTLSGCRTLLSLSC